MKLAFVAFVIFNLLASCVPNTPVAPPNAYVPAVYRGTANATGASLASVPYQQLYADPVLQALIRQTLTKNYSLQQAYAAIVAAQGGVVIAAANQNPFVSGSVQAPYQIATGNKPGSTPGTAFAPQLAIGASYQIDLVGRLASATDAARAQLLATQFGAQTVAETLVEQVAAAYFTLRELDLTLAISLQAVQVRTEDVRLVGLRVDGGESSIQDLYQAQQALYEVTENIPAIRQNIAQTENSLSVLAGDYPHDIERGLPLDQQIQLPEVPPTGVASELLERRPDIRQAEYTLAAADANLDVARKLLYPSLSLGVSAAVAGQVATGTYPNAPPLLQQLASGNGVFYGPLGLFTMLPQLVQPIFNSGQLKAQVRVARAQQQQLAYAYLSTVQSAFAEVSNNIVYYDQARARRVQLALYERSSLDSTRVANERYDAGETSYLEVLNAYTREYQAEIDLAQGVLNERLALVQLYASLGGGWQS